MQWEAIIIVILILIILYVAWDQGYFSADVKPKAKLLVPGPVMGPTASGDEFSAAAPLVPVVDGKAEGFCPKMLHRCGSCNAGDSCH
jgi:hypothetical protein